MQDCLAQVPGSKQDLHVGVAVLMYECSAQEHVCNVVRLTK